MAFIDTSNSVRCHWFNYGDGSNIQNAYNVSSVGDNGTGKFRINYSTSVGNGNATTLIYGGHSSYYDVMASGARDHNNPSGYVEYSTSNNGSTVAASKSFGIVLNNQ